MRKLIVGSFVSLDGVVEGPMSWASPFFDEEGRTEAFRSLESVEYFLLGRVAYDYFSSRWPQIQGDPYMDRLNGMKKLVATRTLTDVAWNASILDGDVGARLRAIKAQPGGDILKYGVTNLDRTLLANQLVDEYKLSILPTRVGHGKRAFEDVDSALLNLELVDTRRFRNGVVTLTYVPR
jgi:dihydrofolate reductase